MASPISNTGSTTINSGKLAVTNENADKKTAASPLDERVSGASSDTLSVSRAAEVLNGAVAERSGGSIQTEAQAREMAQGLMALFKAQPGQAMAAQAGAVSSDLGALLKAG